MKLIPAARVASNPNATALFATNFRDGRRFVWFGLEPVGEVAAGSWITNVNVSCDFTHGMAIYTSNRLTFVGP